MPSEKLIKKLQQIIKEESKEDLTFKQTEEVANGLIEQFTILRELHNQKQKNNDKK